MQNVVKEVETIIFLGHCNTCDLPVRDEIGHTSSSVYGITCWRCGDMTRGERLVAVTTHASCDWRCMGATGRTCECACGGVNHAGAWSKNLTTEIMTAKAVEGYRAHQAKVEAAKIKREESKAAKKLSAFGEWLREGDNAFIVMRLDQYDGDNQFLADMALIVKRNDILTVRQAEASNTALARETAQAAREAQWAAEKAAQALTASPVPTGKVQVTGTVLSTKWYEGDYGSTCKMLVQCAGYKVFGTVPKNLMVDDDGCTVSGWEQFLINKQITFSATVEEKEAGFGTFKRPTKAAKI